MRKLQTIMLSALVLCFLLPVASLAADKNSAKVNVLTPVVLNGTKLDSGTYTFQWTDNGKINVLKGKETVASAEGKVTTGGARQDTNALIVRTGSSGDSVLTSVRLKDGRTLDFSSGSAQESAPSPAQK